MLSLIKLSFGLCILMIASQAHAQAVRTIAVTGEATRMLAPDAFTLNFTFEQKGEDLVSIKGAVDKRIEKATSLLIENKVEEKHIRSMDVTVYPWVENTPQQQINKGFVYRRTVYFTHNDIEAFDSIIKKIAALSPSQIGQLNLINQEREQLERELLQEALANGKAKAQDMAHQLSMEVGHVLFMSDGTVPPEHMFEKRGTMMVADSFNQRQSSLPGENEISTRVNLVFELHAVSRDSLMGVE